MGPRLLVVSLQGWARVAIWKAKSDADRSSAAYNRGSVEDILERWSLPVDRGRKLSLSESVRDPNSEWPLESLIIERVDVGRAMEALRDQDGCAWWILSLRMVLGGGSVREELFPFLCEVFYWDKKHHVNAFYDAYLRGVRYVVAYLNGKTT